jgi:hypothetical protein
MVFLVATVINLVLWIHRAELNSSVEANSTKSPEDGELAIPLIGIENED